MPPKSPTTKHQWLGPIFGEPISSLNPENLPKRFEVIRYWMYWHDKTRTSHRMSSSEKDIVRDKVLSAVISIWESKGQTTVEGRALELRYERLISEADDLGKDPRCKRSIGGDKASLSWIKTKQEEFDVIFDIGEASSSKSSSAPATPLKRKAEELVSCQDPKCIIDQGWRNVSKYTVVNQL